jgi:hypothetical protein
VGPAGVVLTQREGCHFALLPFYIHVNVHSMLKKALESELRYICAVLVLAEMASSICFKFVI